MKAENRKRAINTKAIEGSRVKMRANNENNRNSPPLHQKVHGEMKWKIEEESSYTIIEKNRRRRPLPASKIMKYLAAANRRKLQSGERSEIEAENERRKWNRNENNGENCDNLKSEREISESDLQNMAGIEMTTKQSRRRRKRPRRRHLSGKYQSMKWKSIEKRKSIDYRRNRNQRNQHLGGFRQPSWKLKAKNIND